LSLNRRRKQYAAAELLYALRDVRQTGETALGVTDVDLYVPGEEFVFGQAAPGIGIAVISLHRLRAGAADDGQVLSRAVKEAAHEMGHLRGLGNCRRRSCVMAAATTVEDIDRKGTAPCTGCRNRLRRCPVRLADSDTSFGELGEGRRVTTR
ncbi:MAG: hypothetical protein AAB270_03250, partial [Chloroflexota bacterium]